MSTKTSSPAPATPAPAPPATPHAADAAPLALPPELHGIDVALAPPLHAEGWLSIQLYHRDILASFAQFCPDLRHRLLWEVAAEKQMGGLRRRLMRDWGYPREIRRQSRQHGANMLVHVMNHSYGHLCGQHRPDVITVHDLHYHIFPQHLDPLRRRTWRRRVARIREVGHILTITHHLAGEIQEHLGIPPDRISVAHYGIDLSRFRKCPRQEVEEHFPDLARLSLDHCLIANVGTNLQRKNMPVLLRALRELKSAGLRPKLLKIGNDLRADGYADLIAELGLEDDVLHLGTLSPEELAQVFSISHAHAFPSFYEGFGRPPLEAQACQLPCVLANASCTPEVGGQGALYHQPDDHEELASHLQEVYNNHNTRNQLIEAGLENTRRFTWRNHLDGLLGAYVKGLANS